MAQLDEGSVFVRILELPAAKMARSGSGDLGAFDQWWSAIDAHDPCKLRPRDFMWWNPELKRDEWLYILLEGQTDTGGYELFDFPGGLYGVAACKDCDADIERTFGLIHAWVAQSEVFEKATPANDPQPRYDMAHVITPRNAKETLGYHQMDLFVPIVGRNPARSR